MLLSTHNAHQYNLDHIHLAACWISLSRLSKPELAQRHWLHSNSQALGPLVQHTVRAANAGDIGARELANLAYGVARSGTRQSLCVLFEAVAMAAE